MNATLEQVTPEVAQAIIAQAEVHRLSVNDYLRQLVGLSNRANAPLTMPSESTELTVADPQPVTPQRNEKMLAAIQRNHERLKDMPVSGSTEETLKMIRRARAGEMWGYEPTDYE